MKQAIIRGGLETLYFSGLHHLLRPLVGGVGAILTLHHVRPPRRDAFQPNRLLEVTPEFFERLLRQLERAGIEVISLDEMHRRFIAGDFERRFVCLTFDDGYKDIMQFAYPLLKQYEVPFALYIATSFPDRLGELWWLALEAVIAQNKRIGLVIDGEDRFFDCAHASRRSASSTTRSMAICASMKDEDELRADGARPLRALSRVDMAAFCRDLCMDWEELGELAADPLCTIGAHTVNHMMLKKVADDSAVRAEMDMSRVGDRSRARRAAGASGLSGRRSDLGRAARIPHRRRARLQDRGDDAAGRAVPRRIAIT